jgi:hypothetical protein
MTSSSRKTAPRSAIFSTRGSDGGALTLRGRYREPYNARRSSVTWNLMIGKNPLWVAKQHGHSVQTMLETYAAWLEGTTEADLRAIQKAMEAKVTRPPSLSLPHSPQKLSLRCLQTTATKRKCLISGGKIWRRERDSNRTEGSWRINNLLI